VQMRLRAGPWLAQAVAAACPEARRIAVVTDNHVAVVHAAPLMEALAASGLVASQHVITPGDGHKTLQTCAALYDALADAEIGRNDALVALGGGVVGDITGFVASTYLRGVAYVQIPTTTLAAVDASIGAKTAVNTHRGKNLVGSFYAPQAVLIALSHLTTQARRSHAAGLVEAVKMAITLDAAAFARIQSQLPALLAYSGEALAEVVGAAVGQKAEVVRADGRDRGRRAVLNFGHTVGHAIEAGEDYRLLHGEAVALGMVAETQYAEAAGLCSGVLQPLTQTLLAMNMPVDWRRANLHVGALKCDKKRSGNTIVLPVVPEIGRASLHSVPLDKLVAFVTDGTQP
ncbi:MAG: 3-dehydroquinate synthase, partial [Deltaproteobacteria bacterium]